MLNEPSMTVSHSADHSTFLMMKSKTIAVLNSLGELLLLIGGNDLYELTATGHDSKPEQAPRQQKH